ncbi:Ankyrin and tetratricopeptide repeat-containing protein [Desulfonema limicola]|uniref:Ankyrin and tetratricopeptide repeat-containing protein n=1 Tax=Desulfonema limicola TaxID=45656 RepID=A0A975B6R1_9BACT|nr:ankyrin repeat domain-containing protein [Desulfonema limicola]QTA79818.1 Ankyrin and tetratricopeptide repeat-containing protein [Desulfonema limicola]
MNIELYYSATEIEAIKAKAKEEAEKYLKQIYYKELKDNGGDKAKAKITAQAKARIKYQKVYDTELINLKKLKEKELIHNFMSLAIAGNEEALNTLLKAGLDIDVRGKDGETALMVASASSNVNNMVFLIENGADIHARTINETTTLMYAVTSGNIDAVKLLIEKGVDVDAENDDGNTALDFIELANFESNEIKNDIASLLLGKTITDKGTEKSKISMMGCLIPQVIIGIIIFQFINPNLNNIILVTGCAFILLLMRNSIIDKVFKVIIVFIVAWYLIMPKPPEQVETANQSPKHTETEAFKENKEKTDDSKKPNKEKQQTNEIKVISNNPDAEALIKIGNNFSKQNKYDEALKFYSEASILDPDNYYIYHLMGSECINTGNYKRGITYLNKSLSFKKTDKGYFSRALCLKNTGKYKKAILDYTKAIELNPNNVLSYIGRGETYIRFGGIWREALKDLEKGESIKKELYPEDKIYQYLIDRLKQLIRLHTKLNILCDKEKRLFLDILWKYYTNKIPINYVDDAKVSLVDCSEKWGFTTEEALEYVRFVNSDFTARNLR